MEYLCPWCKGIKIKVATRRVSKKAYRYREEFGKHGEKRFFYRYMERKCPKCKEFSIFREVETPKGWDGTTVVDEQEFMSATEIVGEQRVGSTASQHTKSISRPVDEQLAAVMGNWHKALVRVDDSIKELQRDHSLPGSTQPPGRFFL